MLYSGTGPESYITECTLDYAQRICHSSLAQGHEPEHHAFSPDGKRQQKLIYREDYLAQHGRGKRRHLQGEAPANLASAVARYRGTSLTRKRTPQGPYLRPMLHLPRTLQ
jgi:hypothetical protein